MNAIFNFNRAGLLVQRYFTGKIQNELIFFGIMFVLFMFFRNNPVVVGITILLAGVFYAVKGFKEIHAPANGINYFMIPATQLAKITVSILLFLIYYFAMMLLAYVLGNLAGTALNNLLANIDFLSTELRLFHHSSLRWSFFENTSPLIQEMFTIDERTITKESGISYIFLFIKLFLVIQSLFILGGIYFKHNQIFKTLLALIIIAFAFSIIWGLELHLFIIKSELNHSTGLEIMNDWGNMVKNTSNVFYWLLIPYLWVTAYFRLTEKEI
jgi:hypothetical protein